MKNNQYAYYDFKGCFPRAKRNFIRENVKSIKQMQGLLQEVGAIHPRPPKEDKFKNVPSLMRSRESTPLTHSTVSQDTKVKVSKALKKTTIKSKSDKKKEKTERTDNISKLYETGVIKYPSPNLGRAKVSPKGSPGRTKGQGDTLEESVQNLEGVLPKYLRGRKEETTKEVEEETCPDGHVLLPEEERKETLRVLRQSYADRIQELNSLPVRSDTLRIRRRKTELEEELKRIDGGIKVFQRPKVYVKINA
ncbi:hypothetical protein NQ318_022456 [Aromia moschata]|uniref:Enkurin domain-containing protein n=1 Tax=Aromia moschata TaxID=1265417 RepID=A0AAV8Z4S2_9CUCU|nr:hypothetical protein NQ318_022456 [Aromia moschata]